MTEKQLYLAIGIPAVAMIVGLYGNEVLDNTLCTHVARAEVRIHQLESRANQRVAAFESRAAGKFAAFERRLDQRFAAFESRINRGFETLAGRISALDSRWSARQNRFHRS
jgi:hypothetical protein